MVKGLSGKSTVSNVSYIEAFSVNQSDIEAANVEVTNTGWLHFTTEAKVGKAYSINVTNAASTTNRTFGETNVSYVGELAPFTELLYTPNLLVSDKHRGHQFQHQLYAADNNDVWANSTINVTDIEKAFFPPTKPAISYFLYNAVKDYDMNGMYSGTFDIGVAVASDPDGGVVGHNLTFYYGNRSFVAIINNTFNNTDAPNAHIDISFDSTPYYSAVDNFTLLIKATDDEGVSNEQWLEVNFTLQPPAENIIITGANEWVLFRNNTLYNLTFEQIVNNESNIT
ncbi:unnamed protein product, partial [marine sediment metagenome]